MRAGCGRVTSPKPTRVPSGPGARGRMTTSSPSSRKARRVAVGARRHRLGAVPGQLDQRADAGRGRRRRPCRRRTGRRCAALAPLTVRCASCCAGVQYMPANGGRETTLAVQLDRQRDVQAPRVLGVVAGRAAAAGRGAAARPGLLRARPAAPPTAETEVANDLPRNGPSGTYSHAWMSRADQSLTSSTPKTCSAKASTGTGSPSRDGRRRRSRPRPRCPAACDGPNVGARLRRAAARTGGRPGYRRPRPSRRGRGSRSAGASSSGCSGG